MKWPEAKLRTFCRFRHGGTPSKARSDFWDGDIPWVSPKDMRKSVIRDTEDHITRKAVDEDGALIVPPKSILIVVRSGILVRTVPVALTAVETAFNQDMKSVEVDSEVASPEFVFWYLKSSQQEMLTQGVKRGATVHSIQSGFIESLSMPLPAPREQNRIVELLEQANALCQKRAEADALADRILLALFHKLFGSPIENSKGLPPRPLGELIEEPQFGVSVALSDKTEQQPGMLPVLRIANVTNDGYLAVDDLRYDKVSERKRVELLLKKGDMLFNWRNSPNLVGKTAIFEEEGDFIFASFLFRLRVKQGVASRAYIWFFLNTLRRAGWFESKCRQAVSQANFGRNELCAICVPYAAYDRQLQFERLCGDFERTRKQRREATVELNRLFAAMLHRAFTGELTTQWREAHLKELLAEMEQQAKQLNLRGEKP